MYRRNKNMRKNIITAAGEDGWNNFDGDRPLGREDSAIFESFGEYFKGRLDLEEVRNDPSLPDIEKAVSEMLTDYRENSSKRKDDENFIKDNLTEINREKQISDEISDIKFEIHRSNVNELTAEWVKEWHEKKKREVTRGSKTEEIRDFVIGSLKAEKSEPEIKPDEKEDQSEVEIPRNVKGKKRSLLISYISLSAAAVIGTFIVIKTLLPSSDPGKLYSSYYKPFDVISSVTRDGAAVKQDGYSAAIEQYRLGDYQTAAAGFSNVLRNDTSATAACFFMGITQVASGNYNQAVNLLGTVAGRQGEYYKEALWYLGLASLKTGEKERAVKCFDLLAKSSGFYSERSAEILRRLK